MTMGQATWKLLRYRPGLFLATIFFRGLDDVAPFLTGIIMKAFFDTLTGQAEAGLTPWTFVALFVAVEVGDRMALFGSALVWPRWPAVVHFWARCWPSTSARRCRICAWPIRWRTFRAGRCPNTARCTCARRFRLCRHRCARHRMCCKTWRLRVFLIRIRDRQTAFATSICRFPPGLLR